MSPSTLAPEPLFKILRIMNGFADEQSWWSEGDRISISPKDESWGHSSRGWAGPTEASHPAADITPLHPAFEDDPGPMDRVRQRTKP
jgi:hypothetical protein